MAAKPSLPVDTGVASIMGFTLFSRPWTALVHHRQQLDGKARWVMIGGRLHPLHLFSLFCK